MLSLPTLTPQEFREVVYFLESNVISIQRYMANGDLGSTEDDIAYLQAQSDRLNSVITKFRQSGLSQGFKLESQEAQPLQ